MPTDPEDILADAIRQAMRQGGVQQIRGWNVPVAVSQRGLEENPLAGNPNTQNTAPVFTVGWTGTGTFYPFTADVSFLDGSFMSVDIVTG